MVRAWPLTLSRLLPILGAFALLFFLEWRSTAPSEAPGDQGSAQVTPTRFVLVWIDGLSNREFVGKSGRMPLLSARIARERTLHGPVRACADAVSVPCFEAMTTGRDRFSLFSAVRNFGGAQGVPKDSVLRRLQDAGLRIGLFADPQVGLAGNGLDLVEIYTKLDDEDNLRRGLLALDSGKLDFVILHMGQADEAGHLAGDDSPEYSAAIAATDRLVDGVFQRLGPDDHIVVMGDHGHTLEGRHFAGLDVATYAAYFGPRFTRTVRHPMAMTDHGAIWGQIFGLRFGQVPWVETYFAGAPLSPPDDMPELARSNTALPLWALLIALLGAAALAMPLVRREGRALGLPPWPLGLALVGVAVATGLAGASWIELRDPFYFKSRTFYTLAGLAMGAGVALLLGLGLRRVTLDGEQDGGRLQRLAPLLMIGTVLAAFPTVYKFGGFYTAGTGLVAALALAILALRVPALAVPGAAVSRGRRTAAWSAATLLVFWLVWNPSVRNFAVRNYYYLDEVLGPVEGLVAIVFAALALIASARPATAPSDQRAPWDWRWLLGGAIGLGLAVATPHLPPALLIAPCVLSFALLWWAHRRPAVASFALVAALPALTFLFEADPRFLTPVVVGLAVWPLWARARRDALPLEQGAGLVVLCWLALWTLVGTRLSGLNYDYFSLWLAPGDRVEDSLGPILFLTISLYFSAVLLGLLLVRRAAPGLLERAVPVAWRIARLKLGLVLVFAAAFQYAETTAGPFLCSDVLQEAVLWAVVLLFLLHVPFGETALCRPVAPARASALPGLSPEPAPR